MEDRINTDFTDVTLEGLVGIIRNNAGMKRRYRGMDIEGFGKIDLDLDVSERGAYFIRLSCFDNIAMFNSFSISVICESVRSFMMVLARLSEE